MSESAPVSLRNLRWPLGLAAVMGVVFVGYLLTYGSPDLGDKSQTHQIYRFLLAGVIITLGALGIRLVRFVALDLMFTKAQGHRAPALLHVVVTVTLFFMLILIVAAYVYEQNLTGAIATSAAASLVLGLALQETLGNFFSGLSIQAERPFRIGDVIQTGGTLGRVESQTWRTTVVRTEDDYRIVVPNSVMAREPLEIYPRGSLNRRRIVLPVPYKTAPQRVKTVMEPVLNSVRGISERQPPSLRIASFDDSSVGYEVLYWVDDYLRAPAIDALIRERAWYAFARAGISIPFPHVQLLYEPDAPQPSGDGASFSDLSPMEQAAHERVGYLKDVELLNPLAQPELLQLAERARTLVYGPGERIIKLGGATGSMYVVERGQVEVRVPRENGRTVRVAEMGPGEVFGEMSLLTGEPRSADVFALSEVSLIEVGKAAMADVLAANEQLAELLSEQMSRRIGARMETLARLTEDAGQRMPQETLLHRIRQFFELS